MTISTTTNRASFAGNGTTTAFATGFKFFANSDLTVILVVDATGVETTKVLDTDYTVTGAGEDSGGTVTMNTAPASGETLVIVRSQPYTQTLDLVENDPFPSESVEQAFDKLVIMSQQLKFNNDLKLGFSQTSTATATVPDPVANNLLSWNSAGTDLVNVAPVDVSLVTATAYAQTLLDDANAAEARTTLGAEAADPDILKADTSDVVTAKYTETPITDSSSSNAVTLDFTSRSTTEVDLSENITTVTITGMAAGDKCEAWFKQAAGNYTVSGWTHGTATIKWMTTDKLAPTMPQGANEYMVVQFRMTEDADYILASVGTTA